MSNIVPYGYSLQSQIVPPPTINPLPSGQSQLVYIACTQESFEFLLSQFRIWFDGESWDHVVLVSHSEKEGFATWKRGQAFFILEWQEAYIDAFFLRLLETEESVLDFTVFFRDSEV